MVPTLQNVLEINKNNLEILTKCTPASLPVEYIEVKYLGEEFQDDSTHAQIKCDKLTYPFKATSLVRAPIEDAAILYNEANASKKILELTINISGIIDHLFSPGDAIGILVSNSRSDTEKVTSAIKETLYINDQCEIGIKSNTTKKNAKIPQHIPSNSSGKIIIRDCLDLRSVPKKLFLRSLAEYTSNEEEKIILISVSSKEGSKLYNEMILEKALTFLDILDLCPSCRPPLSLLIEHLPRLKPRPYSIVNSPLNGKNQIKIIFSVLKTNPGVATSYLTELAERFMEMPEKRLEIDFYFRETNKFSYSYEEAKSDTILIAIGCGVAPFLGFLEHKEKLMQQNKIDVGSTLLFVGSTCQESAVHREILFDYQIQGVLQHLYESFSRDAEYTDFKYVQDQIEANATEFVLQFLKKDTILYVCADGTTISKSIEKCITESIAKVLRCSKEEAEDIVKESRLTGKYREDVWV